MQEAAQQDGRGGRDKWLAGLFLIGGFFLFGVIGPAPVANALGEFEPNDSRQTAAGPLVSLQTYSATMETENDLDYFKFYVADRSAQTSFLAIKNSGDGFDSMNMELVDSGGMVLQRAFAFGRQGTTGEILYSVGPGKYFLRFSAWVFSGPIGYEFQVRGGVSPYSLVQKRCKARKATLALRRTERSRAARKLAAAKRRRVKGAAVEKARANYRAANRLFQKASRQAATFCLIPR